MNVSWVLSLCLHFLESEVNITQRFKVLDLNKLSAISPSAQFPVQACPFTSWLSCPALSPCLSCIHPSLHFPLLCVCILPYLIAAVLSVWRCWVMSSSKATAGQQHIPVWCVLVEVSVSACVSFRYVSVCTSVSRGNRKDGSVFASCGCVFLEIWRWCENVCVHVCLSACLVWTHSSSPLLNLAGSALKANQNRRKSRRGIKAKAEDSVCLCVSVYTLCVCLCTQMLVW